MEDPSLYSMEDDMSYTSNEPLAPVDAASPPPIGALAGGNANREAAPARPSLLDILRKRVESSMEQEPRRQLADFGAGMLSSGSRNFFNMLAAGNRAQFEGERTRTQELRQYAEAERQAAAQRANENYRREQARIAQQRYEAEAPLRAAQADYYRRRASGAEGGGLAAQRLAALETQRENALRQNARNMAATEVSRRERLRVDSGGRPFSPNERSELERQLLIEYLGQVGLSPRENATSPAVPPPAPGPARVLQYPRPAQTQPQQ